MVIYLKYFITLLVLISLFFLFPNNSAAQLTIGSVLPPNPGAVLDLKEYNEASDNTTSTRGLGVPRVALISNSSLEPSVTAQESQDISVRSAHIGMMLYNVGDEILDSPETLLCKGLHVWNGSKWVPSMPYPTSILGESVIRCKEGPAYTIDPNSIKVYGEYSKNTVLNNTHYIEFTINSPADIIGGEYIIQTYSPTTNEIMFEGKGIITSTQQTVRLQGTGTIQTVTDKHLVLITNSPSEKNKYPVIVSVTLPKMKIVGVGQPDYNPASNVNTSKSSVLMRNTKAFGTSVDSKIKVEGFQFDYYPFRNDQQWINLFNSKPDIIIRTYASTLSDNALVLTALKAYLDAGGIFLDFNDNNGTSSAGVKALYGSGASSNTVANTVTGQIHPFTDVDDEILNGSWLDLRNKTWSEDASFTQGISGVPEDKIIIYSRSNTNGRPVIAFRDKVVNYVYVGDGGFLSGSAPTSSCCYPFQLGEVASDPKTYHLPVMSSNDKGDIYNSYFYANLITWALRQVAANGTNK